MNLNKAARALSKGTVATPAAAEHGQHIFIYNNIRTNQTVYSLQRNLNNHDALSQLSFAGKKTVPAKLRKDIWRPLATVSFRNSAEGLVVYRNLREFRKLHEQNWDHTKEYPMLPPDAQKRLKESKAAPTKKERAKIIMDQKANSIADLAAVLKKHAAEFRTLFQHNEEALDRELNDVFAAAGRLKKINMTIKEKKEALGMKATSEEKDATPDEKEAAPAKEVTPEEREAILKELKELASEKKKLRGADEAAEAIKPIHTELTLSRMRDNGGMAKIQKEIDEARDTLRSKDEDITEGYRALLEQRVREWKIKIRKIHKAFLSMRLRLGRTAYDPKQEVEQILEQMLEKADKKAGKKAVNKVVNEAANKPANKPRKKANDKIPEPTEAFRAAVRIKWADIRDASHAKQWPSTVKHSELGFIRHSAPSSALRRAVPFPEFPARYESVVATA
ncbi:uncharacterized protein LTHEOB_998 [Lasiodiplodia theobromae]|uniref:Large ribosomal subunit protein mL67 n=1 Tax=Lasiodiplodia theobromae TaxID=45133 RepID=A0A5N5DH67_9PEZI|nr:uncharacterized protein LTHEOB_998 [Lasiodiplodia theobromae]KAB2577216.1 Uncharacterized protein DBV05_g4052 [Lasiodiplodia theobromae]KAF4538644.1 hypothetical protein LTHEOB_998 [Lasiodiplodia theobromae]